MALHLVAGGTFPAFHEVLHVVDGDPEAGGDAGLQSEAAELEAGGEPLTTVERHNAANHRNIARAQFGFDERHFASGAGAGAGGCFAACRSVLLTHSILRDGKAAWSWSRRSMQPARSS